MLRRIFQDDPQLRRMLLTELHALLGAWLSRKAASAEAPRQEQDQVLDHELLTTLSSCVVMHTFARGALVHAKPWPRPMMLIFLEHELQRLQELDAFAQSEGITIPWSPEQEGQRARAARLLQTLTKDSPT